MSLALRRLPPAMAVALAGLVLPGLVLPGLVLPGLVLPGLVLSSSAEADTLQAASCSKGLAPEAMIIYQATAPKVSPDKALLGVLKPTVQSLVRQGKVKRSSARASAMAAAACLKELQ